MANGVRDGGTDAVGELRERLLAQQFLFDDPGAYRAGVYDAFDAFDALVGARDRGAGRVFAEADASHG